jgi:cell division protein FtsZ
MADGVPAPGDEPVIEPTEQAAEVEEASGDDELVLGAEEMVPEQAAEEAPKPRVFGDDEATPAPASRRRWLAGGDDSDDAPPQPRVKLGGTLFERMQNASRGAQRPEEEEGKDSLDIPRFLHRQNNQ